MMSFCIAIAVPAVDDPIGKAGGDGNTSSGCVKEYCFRVGAPSPKQDRVFFAKGVMD